MALLRAKISQDIIIPSNTAILSLQISQERGKHKTKPTRFMSMVLVCFNTNKSQSDAYCLLNFVGFFRKKGLKVLSFEIYSTAGQTQ